MEKEGKKNSVQMLANNPSSGGGMNKHHSKKQHNHHNNHPGLDSPSRSKAYCMSEALAHRHPAEIAAAKQRGQYRPFPIVSFNHMSREVLDYKESRDFYVEVLGFIEVSSCASPLQDHSISVSSNCVMQCKTYIPL